MKLREYYRNTDTFGKAALIASSWFGAGLIPIAPGTFASLAGLPVVILVSYARPTVAACVLLCFVGFAIWTSWLAYKILAQDDPPEVVIDEVAGFLVTLFLVPVSWLTISVGFCLFRLFDITKPFPIRKLEKLKGGNGIVLDDLLAGVYANLCLRVILWLIG